MDSYTITDRSNRNSINHQLSYVNHKSDNYYNNNDSFHHQYSSNYTQINIPNQYSIFYEDD